MKIPDPVARYFRQSSHAWRESFEGITTFEAAVAKAAELGPDTGNELLSVSLRFVSAAMNEAAIYQQALEKLRIKPEKEVDRWLAQMGFKVKHKSLGTALVQRISTLFQSVTQVITVFAKSIAAVLNMKLEEVQFVFSMSPSVTLTFK